MIIIEGDLAVVGGTNHTLQIRNDEQQSLVLDFSDRRSLLYFINAIPNSFTLSKVRKQSVDYLQHLDQDLIINVAGKTAIYRKANTRRLVYNKDYPTALAIFWLFFKRFIRKVVSFFQ